MVDGYDVFGGGIVLGLVDLKEEVIKFVKEDMEMVVSCFDEYYYLLFEGIIRRYFKYYRIFKVGDVVFIEGEIYFYFDSFDIIDLNRKFVVKIRKGCLSDLINLDGYIYSELLIIIVDGFYVKVNLIEEFCVFKDELIFLNINEIILLI